MNDAKSRFFANFEREMADEQHQQQHSEHSTKSGDVDIDFSITESGRTVAHMVTETNRSMATALTDTKIDEHAPYDDDDMDFSVMHSMRSTGTLDFTESERGIMMDALSIRSSTVIGGAMSDIAGLTESDRGALVDAFGPESSARLDEERGNDSDSDEGVDSLATPLRGNLLPIVRPTTGQAAARSIPVPLSQNSAADTKMSPPIHAQHQQQQSTFMSSFLNPLASLNGVPPPPHTPAAGPSFEVSHGKRQRSRSVSGKLQSAFRYLEEKRLLDQQTKSLLNDLFLAGDKEILQALDRYEAGDPSVLENLIHSGALKNRSPTDVDIMGNLDFDFLSVRDENITQHQHPHHSAGELGQVEHQQSLTQQHRSQPIPVNHWQQQQTPQYRPYHSAPPQPNSPYVHSDGIGELDFAGEYVSDHTQMAQPQFVSQQPYHAAHPHHPPGGTNDSQNAVQYSDWMEGNNSSTEYSDWMGGNNSNTHSQHGGMVPGRGYIPPSQDVMSGAGAASAASTASRIAESLDVAEQKRLEKEWKKLERKTQDPKVAKQKKEQDEKDNMEHYTGCGRPRSLSDPNLVTRKDEYGLVVVDRPEGWVGAYSPESRKVRIERFMEKRKRRVWTQSVKYDVRKNFADSRLRVKGRFVKKQDEMLMRELMSVT